MGMETINDKLKARIYTEALSEQFNFDFFGVFSCLTSLVMSFERERRSPRPLFQLDRASNFEHRSARR